jgi:hypothetical protein
MEQLTNGDHGEMTQLTSPNFPPAYCKHCKTLFEAGGTVGVGGDVIMHNVVTNCPTRGNVADILDGTYSVIRDRLNVFLSLLYHWRRRLLLRNLLRQLKKIRSPLQRPSEKLKRLNLDSEGYLMLPTGAIKQRRNFWAYSLGGRSWHPGGGGNHRGFSFGTYSDRHRSIAGIAWRAAPYRY